MNCKPGDLAVIVKANRASHELLGRMLRCVTSAVGPRGVYWVVEPAIPRLKGVYDHLLRPIRDPGDDATDETLSWLPVPTKEKEHE